MLPSVIQWHISSESLFTCPEDGGKLFLRNVGAHLPNYILVTSCKMELLCHSQNLKTDIVSCTCKRLSHLPEGGGTIFLRNVNTHVPNCTISAPRILEERYFIINFCNAVGPTFQHSLLSSGTSEFAPLSAKNWVLEPGVRYPIR
jgi:hypothetical protein